MNMNELISEVIRQAEGRRIWSNVLHFTHFDAELFDGLEWTTRLGLHSSE